jgi:hypothetical protein
MSMFEIPLLIKPKYTCYINKYSYTDDDDDDGDDDDDKSINVRSYTTKAHREEKCIAQLILNTAPGEWSAPSPVVVVVVLVVVVVVVVVSSIISYKSRNIFLFNNSTHIKASNKETLKLHKIMVLMLLIG